MVVLCWAEGFGLQSCEARPRLGGPGGDETWTGDSLISARQSPHHVVIRAAARALSREAARPGLWQELETVAGQGLLRLLADKLETAQGHSVANITRELICRFPASHIKLIG